MSIRYMNIMKSPQKTLCSDNTELILLNNFRSLLTLPSNLIRMSVFNTPAGDTTLKDLSANKQNATLSQTAGLLDIESKYKAKVLNFNSTSDYFAYNDAADLSFGNSLVDTAFSIVVCLNPNNYSTALGGTQHYIGKYNNQITAREYEFQVTPGTPPRLRFALVDDNVTGVISRYGNLSTGDIGTYNTYIGTYNGSAAVGGIKTYKNGTQIDDTDSVAAGYVAMEDEGAPVGSYRISNTGAIERMANCKYSFVAIVKEELSQTQVTAIDKLLRRQVGVY